MFVRPVINRRTNDEDELSGGHFRLCVSKNQNNTARGSLLALLAGDRTSPWGKCTHNAKGELCPSACRCAISQRSDPGQTKGESFIGGNGRLAFSHEDPRFAHVPTHRVFAGPRAASASRNARDHYRLPEKRPGGLRRTGLHRERSFGTQ